jgi:hypothetical protein
MKTLNQARAHVGNQPTFSPSTQPPQPGSTSLRSSVKRCLIAAGLAAAVAAPAWSAGLPDVVAGQSAGTTVDADSAARAQWKAVMKQNSTPGEGCFHASYPNIGWEKVECKRGEPRVHTEHLHRSVDEAEVVGNGNDYVAYAKGLITSAAGIASIVKGVTSEKSVGVPSFGDGGILGPNEYTLQLNTNEWGTTSACAGHNGCHVWQQFVYATDYFVSPSHTAAVFIEYWLLDWGSSKCPTGWNKYETDCWKNSGYGEVPDFKITEVGDLELSATATAGGTDSILLFGPGDTYAVTGNDNVLDISSVWDKAEFNVLGDAGGSEAVFNSGSSIEVTLGLSDGSAAAPSCLANGGTTGETNNLNLGTCSTWTLFGTGGIQFKESN